jgi:hypothetical protein
VWWGGGGGVAPAPPPPPPPGRGGGGGAEKTPRAAGIVFENVRFGFSDGCSAQDRAIRFDDAIWEHTCGFPN